MAARRSTRGTRTEAERARLYAARTEWHSRGIRRRVRDNVIAVAAGALIVIGAVVSQVAHAQVTAPAPVPSPSATASPEPEATAPVVSPEPTPAETTAPAEED